MGIMVYSLSWVMQDLHHQPRCLQVVRHAHELLLLFFHLAKQPIVVQGRGA